jgi:hypothetical protein
MLHGFLWSGPAQTREHEASGISGTGAVKITCVVLDFFITMGYIGIRENPKKREKQHIAHNMAYNAL